MRKEAYYIINVDAILIGQVFANILTINFVPFDSF